MKKRISEMAEREIVGLCKRGLTYAEIGRQTGRTKSGVAGVIWRLGLAKPENSPIKRGQADKKTPAKTAGKQGERGPLARRQAVAAGIIAHGNQRVTRVWRHAGLRHSTCQYLEGEPGPDDDCKCGAPTVQGSPYCEAHLRRCYLGKPALKPREMARVA